ncbi:MAG: thioredoxin domain-containing protein [Myxococcota bacterium]
MSKPNRLAAETSPYLLQHAHNPVDWYPWGKEAFERARAENKPIFLSIGYAACHWCHVMERESFENERVAEFLSQHFISIKVDREERPDVDDIYMAATLAISGSGGWPMSVFLTPELEPFFAGTYFPPDGRYGRPGFLSLLQRIVEAWQKEPQAIFEQAKRLTEHVRERSDAVPGQSLSAQTIERGVNDHARSFDATWGGFSPAPKFPSHQGLRLLMRYQHQTGDARVLHMVRHTLDCMKNGGIYDQVGGGFARYSTDARWLVPHFEKMLYDNAQLAVVYLEAFQLTSDPEYRRIASETLDYVVREMQSPEGGYYSATDADSEGEEGKFFCFVPEEIDDILGKDDAEAFCLYYDISVEGNWEGKNVLNTPRPLATVARELGRDEKELAEELRRSRQKVYEARKLRVPPLLDDKVLTAWNALMIDAMAEGYRILRDPRYLDSAERAARFVREQLFSASEGLLRSARAGKSHIRAFLEDYAYLSDALISLYEAGGNPEWLTFAESLARSLLSDFSAEDGSFYSTSTSHEDLILRVREGHDGALPSANAVAARALARLSHHLDQPELRERAARAVTAYGSVIEQSPRAFASSLLVLDFLLRGPSEIVIVGEPSRPDTEALASALGRRYLGNRVIALSSPERPNQTPLARDKAPLDGKATVYVCRNFACQQPVTEPEQMLSALDADRSERTPLRELDRPASV